MSNAGPRLVRFCELTPTKFAEVGRPYLLRSGHAGRVALCSAFEHLYWPGRATYSGHTLRHRLSLYVGDFAERLAVFDGARFSINDIAFHPTEPWVAIGTGSYDGGYLFEGELLLWNIETGEHRSVLGESREVVRCRFIDGGELAVLLRPRCDDEFGDHPAFETFVGTVLDPFGPTAREDHSDPRLSGLQPIDPASLGFESAENLRFEGRISDAERQRLEEAGYEERHRAWDVAWLNDDQIALVHDCCRFEVWHLTEGRVFSEHSEGRGVQIFAAHDRVLVHALSGGLREPARSTLLNYRDGTLAEWRTFLSAYAFSIDAGGRILARDTGDPMKRRPRLDRVLDAAGNALFEGDLGSYDCFNHYMRLDGGEALYFLRGTPPSSHQHKELCVIEGTQSIRAVMQWDDKGEHLTDGCAAFVGDDCLVRVYRVYGARSSLQQIELYSLAQNRALWSVDVDADVTALCVHEATRSVLFALTNGQIGAIDLDTGAVLKTEQLAIDGVPSVALSIAVRASMAAIGTIDGRLIIYQL